MIRREQIVEFNVGGLIFATTDRTLKKYPGNLLLELHLGKLDELSRSNGLHEDETSRICSDRNGLIFIDRDPELFRHVLNFLRTDQVQTSQTFNDFHLLRQEAHFYKIPAMIQAIGVCESRDSLGIAAIDLQEEKFILVELFSGKNPRSRVFGLEEGHPLTTAVRQVAQNTSFNRTEKSFHFLRMGGRLLGMTYWKSESGEPAIIEKWRIPLRGTYTVKPDFNRRASTRN